MGSNFRDGALPISHGCKLGARTGHSMEAAARAVLPRLHLPGDEAAKLFPFEYFKLLESFNRLLFPSASS